MRYFFLDIDPQHPPGVAEVLPLSAEESHHLKTVLRGGRDDTLRLLDGYGRYYTACVKGRQGSCTLVEILTVDPADVETRRPRLVLGCAVVKGRRFEWALEKAVELGAHAILPLVTEHGVVMPGSGKTERWQTIMKSAAKQCGRAWLPELIVVQTLDQVLTGLTEGLVLFGATPWEWAERPGRPEPLIALAARVPAELPASLALLVGPEGGWSEAELDLLLTAGVRPVTLGPHVLRTETAAAAGLTLLQAVRQAWQSGQSDPGRP